MQMLLVPVSLDGTDFGTAAELPPFTTAPAATAPTPSPDMAVNPLVGPDRFTIQKVQQDRPGMVHVIVTRPNNQATQVRHRWHLLHLADQCCWLLQAPLHTSSDSKHSIQSVHGQCACAICWAGVYRGSCGCSLLEP